MTHVNPTLPNQGEGADAPDISGPILEILAVFNGHIGADNLEPGTIVAAIGTGEITTAKIAAGAVTTAKIADGSITPAKVAPIVVGTSGATITPLLSTRLYAIDDLGTNATIAVPSGTPVDGQGLVLRLKDNNSARTLSWNAIYRGIGVTLPTTTVANKMTYVSMSYNSAATKWDVLSVAREV